MLGRTKRRGVLRDRSVDDDWRCRACDGVCCRSFVAVELSWAEYERLAALGAQRLALSLHGPHKLVIDGGCEFLARGRCRIYAERPEVCRRFICDDVAGCEAPPAGAGPSA